MLQYFIIWLTIFNKITSANISTNTLKWTPAKLINKNYLKNHQITLKYSNAENIFVWDETDNNFYSIINTPYHHVERNNSELEGKKLVIHLVNLRMSRHYTNQSIKVSIEELDDVGVFNQQILLLFLDYFKVIPDLYYTSGKDLEFDVMFFATLMDRNLIAVDMSQPLFSEGYYMFMRPRNLVNAMSYFRALTPQLWLTSIITSLMICLAIYISIKILGSRKEDNDTSWTLCLLSTISSYCSQGFELQLSTYTGRILIFFSLFLGFTIYTALSAVLMSILTIDNVHIPIKTLEELKEKRTYSLCISDKDTVYRSREIFTKVVNAKPPEKVEVLPEWRGIVNGPGCEGYNIYSIPDIICKNDIVILTYLTLISQAIKGKRIPCIVHRNEHQYFITYAKLPVAKGWPYLKNLNKFLLHLRNTGIMNLYYKRYINDHQLYFSTQYNTISTTIEFGQVKPILEIYIAFMILSLLILFIEIILKNWQRKNVIFRSPIIPYKSRINRVQSIWWRQLNRLQRE